jgi:hypothetical protein
MFASFRISARGGHETSLDNPAPQAESYLTKMPGELALAERHLASEPNLHVLCMMRDPRDIVVSRHMRAPSVYWTPLRFWKDSLEPIRRLAGHSRFTLVNYESLVADPDAVQNLIADRIPLLKASGKFSSFPRNADPPPGSIVALGGVRPVDARGVGRWRYHLARVAGQLQLHGSIVDELIEFGYERDASWVGLLDGVEPDLAPSYWPDA